MQRLVGLLMITLMQIYKESEKNCKSIKIWQNYGHEFVASLFRPTL